MKRPLNVVVVDDSKVSRDLIKHIIEKDPDLKVVAALENGVLALDWIRHDSCDVITMDIYMPYFNGLEITKKIMAIRPIPIVIISSGYNSTDKKLAFEAIEAGALAILEKPNATVPEHNKEIIETIKTISEVKVVKRPLGTLTKPVKALSDSIEHYHHPVQAVAIGASLGGPVAISKILSGISSFPVPIFLVQHIADGFTKGFVEWLQGTTSLKIKLAFDGEKAVPNTVYIAPDRFHLVANEDMTLSLAHSLGGNLQTSVATLFKSMAKAFGPKGVGVILTGMGRDGAKELLHMKEIGAFTIAQDEASSIMFGMPKEAIALGGAKAILPLDKIGEALIKLVNHK